METIVANMQVYFQTSTDYKVRTKTHQKKKHLVVPVVMMVEGVHNGSHGPLLHLMEDLGKFPEAWNGIPVVINHPEEDGKSISANSPDVIDARSVGKVYNTHVNGSKLAAELWLDEEKLKDVSEETLECINSAKPVEVSIGVFTEDEEMVGNWKGEDYKAIARNHRPDHLAILPNEVGACSLEDGCGIRANKKKDEDIEDDSKDKDEDEKKKKFDFKHLSDNELAEIEEYIQTRKIESGKIKNVGLSMDVNSSLTRTKFSTNNKKEDTKMSDVTKCPKCLAKIEALITNAQSPFVEADREWLLTQDEAHLDKFAPVVNEVIKEVEKIVEKTIEVNKLSTEDQAALAYGKRQMKERKEKMIQGIQANTAKGVFTDEKLNKMDEDTLESVYTAVVKEEVPTGNYSLNAAAVTNTASGSGGSLYPAGVEIEGNK